MSVKPIEITPRDTVELTGYAASAIIPDNHPGIDGDFRESEARLMNPPSKHNAIKLFRRLYKNVKLTKEQRFACFVVYVSDLAKRELITQDLAEKWKSVNPWPTRPGPLE